MVRSLSHFPVNQSTTCQRLEYLTVVYSPDSVQAFHNELSSVSLSMKFETYIDWNSDDPCVIVAMPKREYQVLYLSVQDR